MFSSYSDSWAAMDYMTNLGRLKSSWVIVFVLVLCGCSSDQNGAIEWQFYAPAVLGQARIEGQPVILNFHADWCAPCHELDRFTFSDERVVESTKSFVMVKVDLTDYESPQSQRLREKFGITGVPEILFLDRTGNEIREARLIGFVGPDDFLQLLNTVSPAL